MGAANEDPKPQIRHERGTKGQGTCANPSVIPSARVRGVPASPCAVQSFDGRLGVSEIEVGWLPGRQAKQIEIGVRRRHGNLCKRSKHWMCSLEAELSARERRERRGRRGEDVASLK